MTTIGRGEEWGEMMPRPARVAIITRDSDVRRCTELPLVVRGGDLWEVLGRPTVGGPGVQCRCVPVDLMSCTVQVQGRPLSITALSHVRIGRLASRHGCVFITNLGLVGGRNLAPRAHPNDGLVHMVRLDGSMAVRERVMAMERSRTGSHIPHPGVTVTSVSRVLCERRSGQGLWIDGARQRGWEWIEVETVPGALRVLI